MCWEESQVTSADREIHQAMHEYRLEEKTRKIIRREISNLLPFALDDSFFIDTDYSLHNTDSTSLYAEDYLGDLSQYTHEEIIKQFSECIVAHFENVPD